MNSRMSDVLLGLIFFGTLIGLGIATIVLSDFQFGVDRHEVEIISPDVGYLRPGDPVLLFGMPAGKVLDMRRLPEPVDVELPDGRTVTCAVGVRCRLDVDVYSTLPRDSRLIIEDRGLLGGKLIRVVTGTSETFVNPESPLVAESAVSALQSAGELLAENRENVKRTFDNFTQLIESANRGRGLLGALFYDETLNTKVKGFADDAAAISARLRGGQGTIGKLLVQTDMYDTAQSGLGEAKSFLTSAREVVDHVKSGQGTLGKLVYSDDLHDQIDGLVTDLRQSKGLLGALVNDPELATKFRHIVDKVLGAVEDARETSPVMGLGSFIFGTF
jgi:phospholipid/cholesterol/gamma-HCH transport system substrate-binding protein